MCEKRVAGAHGSADRVIPFGSSTGADTNAGGYSLMELVIVVVVITILATVLIINLGPMVLSLDVDQVAGQVAAGVSVARRAALGGAQSSLSRQFNLKKSLPSSQPGIELKDRFPVTSNGECQGGCDQKQQLWLCVSGRPFCYSVGQSFIFERFSGRLDQAHAIFILSKSRKLAVLVGKEGKTEIAELINGEWHTSTELQGLLPSQKE